MTTIASSASGTFTNVTSTLTINPFGAYSPQVGDIVFIFLGVNSQIITFTPGFFNQANNTNTWTKLVTSGNSLANQQQYVYYKTFNSVDTTSVTFNIIPYVGLGVGDTGPSSATGVWSSVVFSGSTTPCPGSFAPGNTDGVLTTSFSVPTLLPSNRHGQTSTPSFVYGCLAQGTTVPSLSAPDTLIKTVSNSGLTLATWFASGSSDGYAPIITSNVNAYQTNFNVEVRDQVTGTSLYFPPVVDEGPAGDGFLFVRYQIARNYTVINNTGTYTAQRWPTHDQLLNATKFWYGSNTATSSERTAILSAGLGGDFFAYS